MKIAIPLTDTQNMIIVNNLNYQFLDKITEMTKGDLDLSVLTTVNIPASGLVGYIKRLVNKITKVKSQE